MQRALNRLGWIAAGGIASGERTTLTGTVARTNLGTSGDPNYNILVAGTGIAPIEPASTATSPVVNLTE